VLTKIFFISINIFPLSNQEEKIMHWQLHESQSEISSLLSRFYGDSLYYNKQKGRTEDSVVRSYGKGCNVRFRRSGFVSEENVLKYITLLNEHRISDTRAASVQSLFDEAATAIQKRHEEYAQKGVPDTAHLRAA
jgi:hypothetical protein